MRDILSIDKIKEYMAAPYPVHFFESTASTNTVAAEIAAGTDGALGGNAPADISNPAAGNVSPAHGTLVIARHQSGGRGRLGRSFASPDGSGIYMSIILDPGSANPVLITTAAAVAVCRAIEKVCRQQPQIKWVNDIYLNNKKICGILAEGITDHKTGQLSHVILGIGINCDSDAIPDDLKDIAGAVEGDFSINQLAAEVHNQVMQLAAEVHNQMMQLADGISGRNSTQGTTVSGLADKSKAADFIDDYRQRSMVIGKTISVHKGGYSPDKSGISARALDIDNNGGLKVIYSDGSRETLSTGEISIRL